MDPSVVIQTPSDQLITFLSLSIAYFCFSVQFALFSLNVSVDFRKNVKRYKLHIFAHLEFIPQFQLFSASQNPRRSHFTFFFTNCHIQNIVASQRFLRMQTVHLNGPSMFWMDSNRRPTDCRHVPVSMSSQFRREKIGYNNLSFQHPSGTKLVPF